MAHVAAVKFALSAIFLAATTFGPLAHLAHARSQTDRFVEGRSDVVRVAELPTQGRETYELIRQGGPFPYDKDGSVFGNRERSLPAEKRGFYREYTVARPGARDRGGRRIVCGGHEAKAPETCFYTVDHYSSFRRITP